MFAVQNLENEENVKNQMTKLFWGFQDYKMLARLSILNVCSGPSDASVTVCNEERCYQNTLSFLLA